MDGRLRAVFDLFKACVFTLLKLPFFFHIPICIETLLAISLSLYFTSLPFTPIRPNACPDTHPQGDIMSCPKIVYFHLACTHQHLGFYPKKLHVKYFLRQNTIT